VGSGIRRYVPALVLTAGLFGALFLPDLIAGRVFAYRDVPNYHLPVARAVSEELRAGRFPFWNPGIACGTPLAANPNNYAFYPTRALDLVFSPETAITIHFIGHWAGGGLAIAALALLLGASSGGAAAAAAVFLLSGPVLSLLNFANLVPFLLWIPLTAIVAVRLARVPGARWAGLLAACLAIQTTFAEPTFLLIEGIVVLTVVAANGERVRPGRTVAWAAVAAGLALLLASPVLIPTLRLVADSARSGDLRAEFAYSLRPVELLQLGLPQLFGEYHTLEKRTYWGETLYEGRGPFFLSISFGTAALALAVAGAIARGGRSLVLGAGAVLGVLLAFGASLALLHPLVYSDLFRWIRWPVKMTAVTGMLLPLLAAFGTDAIAGGDRRGRRATLAAPTTALVAAGLAAAAFVLASHFTEPMAAWVADRIGPVARAKDVPAILERTGRICFRAGAIAAAVSLLAATSLLFRRRPRVESALRFVLPLLVIGEMTLPQREVNRGVPAEALRRDTPILAEARSLAARGHRVYFPFRNWEAGLRRSGGMPDEWWPRILFNRELGAFYHAIGEGVPMVLLEPDRLVSAAAAERIRIADLLHPHDKQKLLWLIGVGGTVRYGRGAVNTGDPVHTTLSGGPVSLARTEDPLPIAHWGGREPDVEGIPWDGEFVRGWLESIQTARDEGTVDIRGRRPGYWLLKSRSESPGRVALTESRDPGWRVTVDGEPADVEPYLSDFMAVRVPAGAHDVEWMYRPRGFSALGALSIVGWIGVVWMLRRRTGVSAPSG
jgi:hypothetical protein